MIPDRIKDNVRAVLLSKTDGSGVLVSNFIKDYKSMLHEQLLYRDMGYQSLQDFIKDLPEVCRLEFSDKDMAYRLYGISKPNTFVSSFVKRAEGSDSAEPSRGRRGRGGGGGGGGRGGDTREILDLGTGLDEDWKPNMKGEFTVCFPNRPRHGLDTKEAVMELFGKVGEVTDVNIIKQLTFVRYGDQTSAKSALRIWGESHSLRRADEKPAKSGRRDPPRENNRQSNTKSLASPKSDIDQSESSLRSAINKSETMLKSPVSNRLSEAIQRSPINQRESSSRNGVSSFKEADNKQLERKRENNSFSSSGTKANDTDKQLMQVYIGNWPSEATKDVLIELLEGYKYTNCRIIQGKKFTSKKYVFVDFNIVKEGQRLIDEMNGQMFMNRDLIVRLGKQDKNTVSPNSANVQEKRENDIEKEFERLFVHKGNDRTINLLSPVSRTITNDNSKKISPPFGSVHSSPTKMPPLESYMPELESAMPELESAMPELESAMPELESAMPDLEPITSHEMPSLISNTNNNNYKNGLDGMPELQQIPPASPAQSFASNQSMEIVQLFIGNFPYGTKEWELSRLVQPYGGHSVRMMNTTTTSRSTYAFVSFDDLQLAQMAILNLDQNVFKNRTLTVAMASAEPAGVKTLSPDVSYNAGPLARITCTVGGNNERMVSVEDDSISQASTRSSINGPTAPQGVNSMAHMICKRDDGFNYRKFTYLLKDYCQVVTKLRGDEDFQLNARQKLKVLLTHAENEKFFWGQILVDNVRGESSYLKMLYKVMSDLKVADRTKNVKGMGRCMAPYEGDWYRGWITHIKDREGVDYGDVLFIDYGNTALIPLSELYYTKPNVWTLPPLARPFKVYEIVCQLETLQNSVVVVDVIEPGSFRTNYLSTVSIDY